MAEGIQNMELDIGQALQPIFTGGCIQRALRELNQQVGHASAGAEHHDAGLGIIDNHLSTTAHGFGIGNTGAAKLGYANLVHD